ncbi:MAG: FAD-dependent oxidoreductase [Stenotrophomonas sp.]|nr:FAD-dependent oxidoreductase [Xanthomonadales bacterium]MBN8768557.1 FAD-dependent oxidoreductase [Stenotrophomonas sp.]
MNAPRITVVGAGFAGLTALRTLRRHAPQAELTLVAPRAELHYLPGSIWLPSGTRRREDLVVPLDDFLARQRIGFHKAHATGLSADARVLHTDAGDVANDGLLLATGARFLRKLPGIEHAIIPCDGIAAGEAIRDRLAALDGGTLCFGFGANPNEPVAMRGGPVFEFLFGIDTLLRRQRRRERFRLVFFSPSDRPGQRLGEKAVGMLLDEMRKRGIDTVLGEKPVRFEPDAVQLERTRLDSAMTVFMPGLTGQAWLDATALPRSPGGFVQADAQCRVPGVACTFVAGDGGSFPGPDWLPKQAHQADLQAEVAARNLLRTLRGEPVEEAFTAELICIVDTLDRGLLVTRKGDGGRALPPLRLMHWAKAAFEKRYLRQYR